MDATAIACSVFIYSTYNLFNSLEHNHRQRTRTTAQLATSTSDQQRRIVADQIDCRSSDDVMRCMRDADTARECARSVCDMHTSVSAMSQAVHVDHVVCVTGGLTNRVDSGSAAE